MSGAVSGDERRYPVGGGGGERPAEVTVLGVVVHDPGPALGIMPERVGRRPAQGMAPEVSMVGNDASVQRIRGAIRSMRMFPVLPVELGGTGDPEPVGIDGLHLVRSLPRPAWSKHGSRWLPTRRGLPPLVVFPHGARVARSAARFPVVPGPSARTDRRTPYAPRREAGERPFSASRKTERLPGLQLMLRGAKEKLRKPR